MERLSLAALARNDRTVVLVALALLVALAWGYLVMMALGMAHHATGAIFMLLMWSVMMVAMMAPAAAPMVAVFATMSRGRNRASSLIGPSGAFVLAYMSLWVGFAALATLVQWALHSAALLSPAMSSASYRLSGALLVAAGVYQFTPLKEVCLAKCRNPLGFLLAEWRNGTGGAFVMGLRHGLYCVGCCWLLMALLFVAGVMNLLWIALLTLVVLAEKTLPFGRRIARGLGVAAVVAGAYLLTLA